MYVHMLDTTPDYERMKNLKCGQIQGNLLGQYEL